MPATEVARRAGHGVAVLLKIYAHCIDGQATAANQRIAEALDIQDAEQDPGDEGEETPSRPPEMAGQGANSGGSGQRNRSHRPRPWIFPAPSVACSDLVRGSSRPRPWPAPLPSVPRTPPRTRRPRTHSGWRQPGITPRSASMLVSGMDLG